MPSAPHPRHEGTLFPESIANLNRCDRTDHQRKFCNVVAAMRHLAFTQKHLNFLYSFPHRKTFCASKQAKGDGEYQRACIVFGDSLRVMTRSNKARRYFGLLCIAREEVMWMDQEEHPLFCLAAGDPLRHSASRSPGGVRPTFQRVGSSEATVPYGRPHEEGTCGGGLHSHPAPVPQPSIRGASPGIWRGATLPRFITTFSMST